MEVLARVSRTLDRGEQRTLRDSQIPKDTYFGHHLQVLWNPDKRCFFAKTVTSSTDGDYDQHTKLSS